MDFSICYIEDIVDFDFVDIVEKEIVVIDVDGLIMVDKIVEEFIIK